MYVFRLRSMLLKLPVETNISLCEENKLFFISKKEKKECLNDTSWASLFFPLVCRCWVTATWLGASYPGQHNQVQFCWYLLVYSGLVPLFKLSTMNLALICIPCARLYFVLENSDVKTSREKTMSWRYQQNAQLRIAESAIRAELIFCWSEVHFCVFHSCVSIEISIWLHTLFVDCTQIDQVIRSFVCGWAGDWAVSHFAFTHQATHENPNTTRFKCFSSV